MTTSEVGGSGVPQFLTKLWLLVEDSSTDHLIKWGQEGISFTVLDQPRFAKEVLPQFFKHSNMASFVRQLNMYGFRKKTSIDQGSLRSLREDVEFMHPHFKRGEPTQLELIKRKVASNEPKVKTEEVHKILHDVKGIKVKQDDINGTLDSMKRENQALWSEVMILRQRHDKQQKIVNRLIQFLLTLVNPVGVKRKQHLAIEPSSSGPSRPPKYGRQVSLHAGNLEDLINLQTASNMDTAASLPSATLSDITGNHNTSGSGATVSEVTSPLDPTARTFPDPNQANQLLGTQQQQQPTIVRTSTPASISSETVPNTVTSLPVSELITPMSLSMVPGLGDIASMPISEILAPSTAATMPVSSSPIVTSPPPSVDRTPATPLSDDSLNTPEIGLELIPKESGDSVQSPFAGMLKRALSTEEIEQKEQLGTDLNQLQANLDSIQSLLNGNTSLSVDPDVLLGVFNHGGNLGLDDSNLFDLTEPSYEFNPANLTGTTGTEMIEYNPDACPLGAIAGISGVDVSDDDSLLESLNEDSRALAKNRIVQEEID